jgi:long-chain acyl-CoA synthetase
VPASVEIIAEQIAQDIRRINQHLPDYARVQKFIVAADPFTPANQLLTGNGRLRRAAILGQYLNAIAAIYSDTTTQPSSSQQPSGVVYDIF